MYRRKLTYTAVQAIALAITIALILPSSVVSDIEQNTESGGSESDAAAGDANAGGDAAGAEATPEAPAVEGALGGGPTEPIPEDPSQIEDWFAKVVSVPYATRKASLDPELVTAQDDVKVIKVSKDGSGEFKTITEALKTVPAGNTARVIISIGPGEYKEKITIQREQPFVTFFGDPANNPTIVFGGTALQYGTVDSATVIALGAYFVAVNIIFANSAPKPTPDLKGAQAVAIRVSGDKSAFYNCRFLGFQDTICDDRGKHFFKDNFIQGTVDYIFGSGTSIYLKNELKTLGDEQFTFITAQAREKDDDTGYVIVHCKCTGEGTGTYLGRSWQVRPRVVFAYTIMEAVIRAEGWTVLDDTDRALTVLFHEYKNSGPGGDPAGRAKFVKQLSDEEAANYLTLDFIQGSKWLLPPPVSKDDGSIVQE